MVLDHNCFREQNKGTSGKKGSKPIENHKDDIALLSRANTIMLLAPSPTIFLDDKTYGEREKGM